jgi:hypothetical protein
LTDVAGRATAITTLTRLKPHARLQLAAVFWVGRHVTATLRKLQALSFIHYARWVIVDGDHLLFESNFNGTWDQYIDAFSEVVAFRMKAIWGTSFGFPGPLPVEPFKQYIRRNEFVANHYWSAYPGATTTEIVSAGRVEAALEQLKRRAATLGPEAFKAEYESFLTSVQRDL